MTVGAAFLWLMVMWIGIALFVAVVWQAFS